MYFSLIACYWGAVHGSRPAWVCIDRNCLTEGKSISDWRLSCIVLVWTEASMCDAGEMVFYTPSWNTDQGVQHMCEYRGDKLPCVMKVTVVGPFGHYPPATILREKGLSVSIHVGTRKMVNYAWIGWSQGKLWWRLVAILTCKSIVKFGYRGERLIEPSSSWFPPKFPSG